MSGSHDLAPSWTQLGPGSGPQAGAGSGSGVGLRAGAGAPLCAMMTLRAAAGSKIDGCRTSSPDYSVAAGVYSDALTYTVTPNYS